MQISCADRIQNTISHDRIYVPKTNTIQLLAGARHDHGDLEQVVGNAAHRTLRQAARDLAAQHAQDDEAMAELVGFGSPTDITEAEPPVVSQDTHARPGHWVQCLHNRRGSGYHGLGPWPDSTDSLLMCRSARLGNYRHFRAPLQNVLQCVEFNWGP